MESSKINLEKITQIPENEFKEHFRKWMEHDDIARCLQAKLRKDLILNFNKTALGKQIIAQSTASNRLTLSPLVLAINTLVAEFLYAQNCHFTLSVFCTEVPYRNTLPDFESVRHFRFTEAELHEIFAALSPNWGDNKARDEICKLYTAEKSSSLLFALLKWLLHTPTEKGNDMPDQPDPVINDEKNQEKKILHDYYPLRQLNKFLKVFLKKVKQMSANLGAMQTQKVGQPCEKKSMSMRKLESLDRSMHKISENLRLMRATKSKSRNISTIISAINSMTKQFENTVLVFQQASSKQPSVKDKESGVASVEKTYSDWIREMRTTPNGKKFLEKVEQSLHKALVREKDKMQEEFQKRLQIQKGAQKAKYKLKLIEELSQFTSREKANTAQLLTDTLEKSFKEFEQKSKEVHESTCPQTKSNSQADLLRAVQPPSCNKETQTSLPIQNKFLLSVTNQTSNRTRLPDIEQVDNIVLDARQRVHQLELESNQLERNIREFLEKQTSEKKLMNENASNILSTYAVERSILEKKCAIFRPLPAPATVTPSVVLPRHSTSDLNARTNLEEAVVLPTFENAFRVAHKELLAKGKSKTRPQAIKSLKAIAAPQHLIPIHDLIDKNKDDLDSKTSPPCSGALKATVDSFKTNATAESVSLKSEKGQTANSIVERHLFEIRDNSIPPESKEELMNANHCEEVQIAMKHFDNDNLEYDEKDLTGHNEKCDGVNGTVTPKDGNKIPTSVSELEIGTTSSHSFQYFNVDTREVDAPKGS